MSNMIWPVFILPWAFKSFISYGAIWLMFHLLLSRWSIKLPLNSLRKQFVKTPSKSIDPVDQEPQQVTYYIPDIFGCTRNIHASEGNTFWGSSAFFYSFKLMLATFYLLAFAIWQLLILSAGWVLCLTPMKTQVCVWFEECLSSLPPVCSKSFQLLGGLFLLLFSFLLLSRLYPSYLHL